MFPLALEMAVGAERFSPIATVIIGGITMATVLTMILVPTLFVLLSRRAPRLSGDGRQRLPRGGDWAKRRVGVIGAACGRDQ
ncbi:hypothetical protein THITH_08140 [Thioalkalivibrio paradoxus ARh 1]|uniref:Acriflavin resistance protein n=1 Tax=Thioalkalivibrio paradoxus ARh 1 TaxID=713585 RepID=W0DS07_9GAMM|nr:hypothetical protein THITH_08140 [Thioalkalivibrio paradoxus ARh 1]